MSIMCKTFRLLAGVVTASILMPLPVSAVEKKYLIVPVTNTVTTSTCTAPDEVESAGNRCWKDRNLGATQVATSLGHAAALGDYYQWGRPRDGHQHPTSATTSIQSVYDDPEHGNFIIQREFFSDWRNPKNDNLWQGLGGISNPCPQGFRLLTVAEWETEIASWGSRNAVGALASPLKLVWAGQRTIADGSINFMGERGYYWSSTIYNQYSRHMQFNISNVYTSPIYRLVGMSVRCIKD